MKIKVKLFGTLEQDFPGYDPLTGMTVDIPDDASVETLLAHLDIPEAKGCFVSMNNTIAKPDDQLIDNATVLIFQALAGG